MTRDDPDLVLHGGRIYTVDSGHRVAEALAVRDGVVTAVGADSEVCDLAGPSTTQVDLRGRTVVPGFNDSHNHMSTAGIGMLKPSLEGARSMTDIQDVIRRAAGSTAWGEWIVTAVIGEPAISHGLREGRYPFRWELDAAAPAHPVCIQAPHVCIVNSAAIGRLGLTPETESPPGGDIGVTADGELDGRIYELAWRDLVAPSLPELTHDDRVAGIRLACRKYNEMGITQISEHGIDWPTWEAYREVYESGELTVRGYVHYRVPAGMSNPDLDDLVAEVAERGRTEAGGDVLKLAGIKTFIDGGVGIGTALFHEPYVGVQGTESHGVRLQDGEQFEEVVRAAVRHDVQLSQHDSGDAAIDLALDTYERVNADTPLSGRRFVMVHCQFPAGEARRRIRELGVMVAAQTVFLHNMGRGYIKHIGRERAQQAMPIRTLLDEGVPVGLGSDAPVNPPDPLLGLWHAQTRQERGTGEVIGGAEAISRAEALRAYTRTNAYLSFEEHRKGSLEAGKVADLVVLPRDVLRCPVDEVPEVRPDVTLVGGRVVAGVFD